MVSYLEKEKKITNAGNLVGYKNIYIFFLAKGETPIDVKI